MTKFENINNALLCKLITSFDEADLMEKFNKWSIDNDNIIIHDCQFSCTTRPCSYGAEFQYSALILYAFSKPGYDYKRSDFVEMYNSNKRKNKKNEEGVPPHFFIHNSLVV